jgi:hypothetical protein
MLLQFVIEPAYNTGTIEAVNVGVAGDLQAWRQLISEVLAECAP